jgi:hypothetical protein
MAAWIRATRGVRLREQEPGLLGVGVGAATAAVNAPRAGTG